MLDPMNGPIQVDVNGRITVWRERAFTYRGHRVNRCVLDGVDPALLGPLGSHGAGEQSIGILRAINEACSE